MNKLSKAIAICLTLLCICLPLLPLTAQPDLIVDQASLLRDLRTDLLDNNDPCYINEGCVGGLGDRQLIRFTTHIKNIGTTDFVVGTPPADPTLENDTWEYDQCHQHWHYEGYAQYLLFDQAGNEIPVGLKNGFCLMDSECSDGGTLQYHCGYQGISAGCGDIYGWGLDCQWVDVTDVPSGIYRLVNRVNWTRDLDVNGQAESNYDNNSASVCIQLSRSANGMHLFQVLADDQCSCSDSDADGICASEDCDDNDSTVPATPGANCDDGNANTSDDVILIDGCTCQGTAINTGGNQTVVDCNGITLTYGDGQIEMAGVPSNTYYFKIHDLNNAWKEVFSCALNCNSTQIASLPSSFYKVKVYNASWTPICDTDITLTGNTGTCADIDGDGVCAADDCDDSDASIPAAPGTSCSDGNANTSTDVIQADGCTCLGVVVTGCIDGDVDGDGVCALADCDDTDASIPAAPGTSCNDGNANTSTDEIQADGCTCLGVVVTGCVDVDSDGVCADTDCDDTDASVPAAPGTSCNDGDANTSTDVIQADGCTCLGVVVTGCVDVDGDGVCADTDCDDTDASIPAAPGTSCNDGDANTSTDVIQADGCTCLGTNTNTGNATVLACNGITITYGNGQIEMTGPDTYYFKIHDLNNGWQEVFSCALNCGSSQVATVPPSFYKVKVYNASWVPICDTDITVTSSTTTCTDIDGDGVCIDIDCDDTDATVPATPGTNCDDGNANTANDVIQADGCTCVGVVTTGCTDIDGDGVCAIADCDDTNANVPTAPGTICNDGNANTANDIIQADGCTCLGVVTTGCTDIDGDGVCAIADCDDTNANVPTAPGTICNDGNANTANDVIQADGCTCLGVDTTSNTGTCSDIVVTTAPNTILITGLTVPIEIIKIYNISGGWQQVFNCVANCGDQQTIDNLSPGNYVVEVQFYSASWGFICSEQIDAVVSSTLTEDTDASFFRIGVTSSFPTKSASLTLFPNPAKETVSLNLNNWKKEKLAVTVYNHLAQEVLQTQILNGEASIHQLAIATLPNGLYIVKVSDGAQEISKKLFITR